MDNKSNILFSKTHEWISVRGDIATLGITDHAQSLLGDIVYLELPREDVDIEANASIGVVESVKTASDIFSPISGTIYEVNNALEEKPELVNEDPYNKGWIVKIRLSSKSEIESLMSEEDYEKFIAQEEQ